MSYPWLSETKEELDNLLGRILFIYRRVAVAGDEALAKEQLRSQLREKVVVDRETVWSQMVSGHRSQGIFRSVEPAADDAFEMTSGTNRTLPAWVSTKAIMFIIAAVVLVVIVQVQPFDRVEESNCLAMLAFCTILWATEVSKSEELLGGQSDNDSGNTTLCHITGCSAPSSFPTSAAHVRRRGHAYERCRCDEVSRPYMSLNLLTTSRYIFSQMFSPTIMLLIGGFTIAAVLSKSRLDVMTATRILNAAGSNPSVVLLVLMLVATFASMWISNVAAPTLCYALVKVMSLLGI